MKRLDFFYIEKRQFVLAIAGSFFVVSGEIVRDKGTNIFYDPHADTTFQVVNGERVSALSYEAFGTYPHNLDNLSHWKEKAVYASLMFACMNKIHIDLDTKLSMLQWLETHGWDVSGFGSLNMMGRLGNDQSL